MSIGRPSFYPAALLDDAETRLLYDRLVLESDHPENKLLIPKFRRKKNSVRCPSTAIEAIVTVGKTADSHALQSDLRVLQGDLDEAQNASKHSSSEGDS
jgi:hypothetical protein